VALDDTYKDARFSRGGPKGGKRYRT
jgi:hypothetical protein